MTIYVLDEFQFHEPYTRFDDAGTLIVLNHTSTKRTTMRVLRLTSVQIFLLFFSQDMDVVWVKCRVGQIIDVEQLR
jgi:hypothetical protein